MTRVLTITVSGDDGVRSFIRAENAIGDCVDTAVGKPWHLKSNAGGSEIRIFRVPNGAPAALGDRVITLDPGLTAQIVDRDLTSGMAFEGPGSATARMLSEMQGVRTPLPHLPDAWTAMVLSAASGGSSGRRYASINLPGMKGPVVLEHRAPPPVVTSPVVQPSRPLPHYTGPAARAARAAPSPVARTSPGPVDHAAKRRGDVEAKFRAGKLTAAQFNAWSKANPPTA